MILAVLIAFTIVLGSFFFANGQAHAQQGPQSLQIKYAGGTAEPHVVQIQPEGKYSVSQPYSWVRDEASRYSLVSYSINDGPSVDVIRKSRGNFLLDVPTGSAHTITFQTAVQYPVSGTTDSENLLLTFDPPSPTGDDWFDAGSAITITVSNREQTSGIRQQIVSWSLDNSKRDIDSPRSSFTLPVLQVAAPHQMKFVSVTQYYLDIVSSHGTVSGEAWYDAGTIATVSVQSHNDFLLPQNFAGWHDSSGNILHGNFQSMTVDTPITLTAEWAPDYTRLLALVISPIAAAFILVVMKRFNSSRRLPPETMTVPSQFHDQLRPFTPLVAAQKVSKPEVSEQSESDNSYSIEIAAYSKQKSVEKLQALQASGLVSDTKLVSVKEKLEDALE